MSSPALARVNSQDQPLYWTDDIPVCHLSAVGISNNQIYRDNAPTRREEHECEDSSFRFRPESDSEIFLYGVFDGHEGSNLSNFAAQRFPAEILLGQLSKSKLDDDDEILNVLHQAFVSVEKAYLDSIANKLAERYNLREQLPALEGSETQEAFDLYNDVVRKLDFLDAEIAGGTSAVIALIIKKKLYVAGVGCCRALLCKTDSGGVLRVQQLTMDHDVHNEEELQRLSDLGIDIDKIRAAGKIGKHPYTRSIGDYSIKLGYKDLEMFSTASSDPVIAEPEMSNGIELHDNSCFLILMSSGVYKSLEDAAIPNVNVHVASSVASEFAVQSTISGVAQGVVDKIARNHHDAYVTNSDGKRREICSKREDMTLLVRNFNYPMPNCANSPSSTNSPLKPINISHHAPQTPLSVIIPTNNSTSEIDDHRPMFTIGSLPGTRTERSSAYSTNQLSMSTTYTSSNDSTQSGEESGRLFSKPSQYKNRMPLDSDGKIEAYVSFEAFNEAIDKLSEEDKAAFITDTEPNPDFETIPEEREMASPISPQLPEINDIGTTSG